MTRHALTGGVLLCSVILPMVAAHANANQLAELKRMSVDELLNVEVTSVSRREEDLRKAAAAVAVVSGEDIRRSGATSLPEALRLVPGLHVARINATSWTVSSRGFSGPNSEKLLVLSDTRSIYTPLFSGVAWDVQDYLLEDVERVEVIRGPGAALWGSNAVNGVINVTTRSARDTHGSYLEAGAGEADRFWLGARQGGETAGGKHYRLFARYHDRAATRNPIAVSEDDAQLGHLGFRMDWDGAGDTGWTVQGDAYAGTFGQFSPAVEVIGRPGPTGQLDSKASGGNLLARWRRAGEDSDLQVRGYYDLTRRDDPSFKDTLHTFDLDLQQRFRLRGHELLWGIAGRLTSNRNEGFGIFAVDPGQSDDVLISGFIQDHITVSDSVTLTLGTKLEHNDFSGFEVQPSIRAAWSRDSGHTLWVAASRAVRVPSRLERDIRVDASDPLGDPVFRLLGNRDFNSEHLIAYEAGYRWQPTRRVSLDLALFHNDYDKLVSLELGDPFLDPGGQTIIPIFNRNLGSGNSRGAELLVEWQPVDHWRLTASYSAIDLDLESSGLDLNRNVWLDGSTPRDMAALRSLLTLGNFELDAMFRHHSPIRRLPNDETGAGLDAYSALDLRVGWRLGPEWRLTLMGQNLLDDSHVEFGTPASRGELERVAYLKAEWRHE